MTTPTPKPKPCPFCGAERVAVRGAWKQMFVACDVCGAEGPWTPGTDKEVEAAAITAWNRAPRHPTPVDLTRHRSRRARDRKRARARLRGGR